MVGILTCMCTCTTPYCRRSQRRHFLSSPPRQKEREKNSAQKLAAVHHHIQAGVTVTNYLPSDFVPVRHARTSRGKLRACICSPRMSLLSIYIFALPIYHCLSNKQYNIDLRMSPVSVCTFALSEFNP